MLENFFSPKDVAEFRVWLDWTDNFFITVHKSPDGDAVGSALALAHYLRIKDKNVTIAMHDNPPDFLMWMPGISDILISTNDMVKIQAASESADVICCLDFNTPDRCGSISTFVKESRAKKIMIDHHPEPDDFCDVMLSRLESSSTCELIFHLICALGDWGEVTRQIAECICTGMITDTGGFAYNSNSPQFFFIISQLMEKNVDKDLLYRRIFNNYSEDRLRLTGFVLSEKMQIIPECNCAFITLSAQEKKRFHCSYGDTEGLVNMPLQIRGIRMSAFFHEDLQSGIIKVSLRSVGEVPANRFAGEFFGGGGHLNAAGGEFNGTVQQCVETLRRGLKQWEMSEDSAVKSLFVK